LKEETERIMLKEVKRRGLQVDGRSSKKLRVAVEAKM
jgi:hypothetical protein